MTINRRQVLQLAAVGAAGGGMQACGGGGHTISPDTAFPRGPYGAESTAEEVTARRNDHG